MPSFKTSSIQAMLALAASTSALPTFSSMQSRQASQAPSNLCGMPDDSLILTGTPWIVYNMMYNSGQIEGSACTGYVGTTTDADGNQAVKWNSTWNIEYVQSTDNVPKGYSFVGLTQNLENRISDISSIPTSYEWKRTNTTAYKGNVCYDFMTSDTKGDSTSSKAQELMLWLQYEGGQLPIGWTDGAVATIDNLYGTSWKLYQGKNDDTGITVSSLLPDTQFDGSFSGDIMDWLEALVKQDLFTKSTYVNVGNAGTEPFYGNAVLDATLALEVKVGSSSSSVAPVSSSVAPTSTVTPSSTTKAPASTEAPVTAEASASSAPVATPSFSAVTFILPSSSSTLTVDSTELPTSIPTTLATTTTPASSSVTADGAGYSAPSSSIETPASYTTLPATPSSSSLALSTPAIPTPSAADPSFPTGNYGPPAATPSGTDGSSDDDATPTPEFGAGVSGGEGEIEGPCAVEYIYV